MRLPFHVPYAGRNSHPSGVEAFAEIQPQAVSCKLDLTGRRTRRHCEGPSWARVCVNVPEFKEGQCRENGRDCTDCFGRCRDQFTSAGGWTISSEWGRQCS